MKKLLFLLLILGLGSCSQESKQTSDLLSLIPPKTTAILRTDDLQNLVQDAERNTLLHANTNLPISKFFKEAYTPINQLRLSNKSIWAFTKIGRDEIASTLLTTETPKLLDSLGYEEVQDFDYNGEKIKEYKFSDKTVYGVKLKQYFAFGDSKLVIENVVRLSKDKITPDEELEKIFNSSTSKRNTLYINMSEFGKIAQAKLPNQALSKLENFSNWISLDLDFQPSNIKVSGVSIPQQNELLGVLKNTEPQKTDLAKITPSGATGLISFTFDDFDQIKENISFYNKEDYPDIDTELFSYTSEIGLIYKGEQAALAIKSDIPDDTAQMLQEDGEKIATHRGHDIYSYSNPAFFNTALAPLVDQDNYSFFTTIDNFMVFAANQGMLENLISNYENNTVLSEGVNYQKLANKLDEKSSFLFIGINKNLLKKLEEAVDSKQKKEYENTELAGYAVSAIQFINHDNFTYINGRLTAQSENGQTTTGGVQTQNFKPGEEITSGPWFFKNWRTNKYDIVLQGKSNKLYFYNQDGKLAWTRQVDGQVIGDIQPIDIYQNRRIQMAFVTPQTFYIIDREGNIVKPFNKTFKSTITQPLSIFDYNNNGSFRFIVTQDKHLTMLDKNLDLVKGFEFTQASSKVLQAPKHYRKGSKDYIVIPEKSGKLNILNPRGQQRINVSQKIAFSDNGWYVYKDLFTSSDSKGQLVQVDLKGGVNLQNLKLDGQDHGLTATANTLVYFSENKLSIKGKTVKLNYGLYTKPHIFYLNDKIYVSITDIQNHKVYLYDSNAELIAGFPVYGNSSIDLQFFLNEGVKLIVKGEADSALLYDVN